MATTSLHGPGPGHKAQEQYSSAVFQALDDPVSSTTPSASASASTARRDSVFPLQPAAAAAAGPPIPIAISAGPFTSRSGARLTPFPHSLPRNCSYDAPAFPAPVLGHIHPSDLEATQGLIRLSASLEPRPALPGDDCPQGLSPHPSPPGAGAGAAVGAAAFVPSDAPSPSLTTTNARSPHPSTSPDENHARHSDVFSVADNSDTISAPDVDPERSGLPFIAPASALQKSAISTPPEPYRPAQNAMSDAAPPKRPATDNVIDHQAVKHHRTDSLHRLYDPSAPATCTCHGTPRELLCIIDDAPGHQTPYFANLVDLYRVWKDTLCSLHKDRYATAITNALVTARLPTMRTVIAPQAVESQMREQQPGKIQMDQKPLCSAHDAVITGSGTIWRSLPYRRRATSIAGFYEYEIDNLAPAKRLRLDESPGPGFHGLLSGQSLSGSEYSRRPQIDPGFDERFRLQVLGELARDFTDGKEDEWSRGECTNRYIHKIVSRCKRPNTDPRNGAVDAGFLSGQEAADAVDCGLERIPIFTEGQQQFQWKEGTRPIAQLFSRMEDLSREVSVQIPSHGFELPSFENKSLAAIQQRFFAEPPSADPWNILDLRSPLPPSILPRFLTGENCQLLPRIRDTILEGRNAERTKAHREDWNEWTDLLEWVLLSEGGHNTAPHMDSHGWSTWITIQEGNFGFGWLSRPTDKEREDWMASPLAYTGGNWRFAILKPGQTVFFPSGTIHFVFRLHDKQTLALGGHLLQWTQLERWVEVIQWQLRNPNITNEELGKSPLKYLHMAEKLAANRVETFTRVQDMGGLEAVNQFRVRASVSVHLNARVLGTN